MIESFQDLQEGLHLRLQNKRILAKLRAIAPGTSELMPKLDVERDEDGEIGIVRNAFYGYETLVVYGFERTKSPYSYDGKDLVFVRRLDLPKSSILNIGVKLGYLEYTLEQDLTDTLFLNLFEDFLAPIRYLKGAHRPQTGMASDFSEQVFARYAHYFKVS